MISINKFTRSIVISSAIALCIVALSNPSSAGKKKIAYVCAIANDVIIRESSSFRPIGKMSKGQCIKANTNMDEPATGEPEIIMNRNGRYYGLQGSNGGNHGYVSTKFSNLTYR